MELLKKTFLRSFNASIFIYSFLSLGGCFRSPSPFVYRSESLLVDNAKNFLSDVYPHDIDGDGDMDLVLLGLYPGQKKKAPVYLVLNQEKEQFEVVGPLGQLEHARHISFCDFNSDGKKDFVIADHGYDQAPFSGGISPLIFQQNSRKFYSPTNQPAPRHFTFNISCGDVDGDGHQDLYYANLPGHSFLLGNGKGQFTKAHQWLPYPAVNPKERFMTSHLFDANGDGRLDLFLGAKEVNFQDTHAPGPDRLFLNQVTRFESAPTSLPRRHGGDSWGTAFVTSADFNRDGRPDLLLTTHDQKYVVGTLQVLLNLNETFQSISKPFARHLSQKSWFIQASPGDINGDGYPDILTHKRGDPKSKDNLVLYLNRGGRDFELFPLGLKKIQNMGFLSSHFLDWDGDGHLDIVAINYDGDLTWLKNRPSAWPQ